VAVIHRKAVVETKGKSQ